jgi:hypothetical protein
VVYYHKLKLIAYAEPSKVSEMPNPLQKLAGDEELYVVMLPLW